MQIAIKHVLNRKMGTYASLDEDEALKNVKRCEILALRMQDTEGNTCLHYAVHQDCKKVAIRIVERLGVDALNIQNTDGKTAMHVAFGQGHGALALLLSEKASIETLHLQDTCGNTCLHYAVRSTRTEEALQIVERLGVNSLGIPNTTGQTALQEALETCFEDGGEDMALVLLKKASLAGPYFIQDASCCKTVLHMVLDLLFETRSCLEEAAEASFRASFRREKEIKKYQFLFDQCVEMALLLSENTLLETLQFQDTKGNTSLHVAVYTGCKEVSIKIVERLGADDLGIQNADGQKVLHFFF